MAGEFPEALRKHRLRLATREEVVSVLHPPSPPPGLFCCPWHWPVWNPWMVEILEIVAGPGCQSLSPAVSAGFWRNN